MGSEEVWGIDLERLASCGTGVCMMLHRLKGKLGLHESRDWKDIQLYEYIIIRLVQVHGSASQTVAAWHFPTSPLLTLGFYLSKSRS